MYSYYKTEESLESFKFQTVYSGKSANFNVIDLLETLHTMTIVTTVANETSSIF